MNSLGTLSMKSLDDFVYGDNGLRGDCLAAFECNLGLAKQCIALHSKFPKAF